MARRALRLGCTESASKLPLDTVDALGFAMKSLLQNRMNNATTRLVLMMQSITRELGNAWLGAGLSPQ